MEWTVSRDYMGMLATVINGMALQGALEDKGMLTVYKLH
jgi:uridylate kinase